MQLGYTNCLMLFSTPLMESMSSPAEAAIKNKQISPTKNIAKLLLCILLLMTQKSFSQVAMSKMEIPENIKQKYPFIDNTFYIIDCEQTDSNIGYFVFTLDKIRMKEYYINKTQDTLTTILKQNGFYNDDCWFNLTCNGETVKKIQGQKLIHGNFTQDVKYNNTVTSIMDEYRLWGHAKIWSKFTCINPNPFNWCVKICEDRPTVNTGDFPLVNTIILTNIWFSYSGNSQLEITNSTNLHGQILWNQCNKFTSPYCSYASRDEQFKSLSIIDFSQFGDIFTLLMQGTKKVKITQDEKSYYVYCIKTSSK